MKKEKTKVNNKQVENLTDNMEETTENAQTIVEQEMAKKRVPKEVSQEILKKIFKNLILAIVVMIYFIASNILYTQFELDKMELITKIFSGVFLLSGIVILEIAYKKESGTLLITTLELFVLAIHALFINHVITIYKFDFRTYILTSSYIFAIYYVLKSTVIYTKARWQYLRSLSDISEIVKDEPIIKEAKKRNEEPTIEINEEAKKEKEEKKTKPKSMRGKIKNLLTKIVNRKIVKKNKLKKENLNRRN